MKNINIIEIPDNVAKDFKVFKAMIGVKKNADALAALIEIAKPFDFDADGEKK